MAGNAAGAFERGIPDASMLQNQGAQLGYARGGPVQTHQTYDNMQQAQEDPRIRNVWKGNLKQEMANLRALVDEYPYIAMVILAFVSPTKG